MVTATQLNPTQLYLLQLFASEGSEETKEELQDIVSQYYFNKLDAMSKKIWDEMSLTPEKLEEMCNIHERTPYV